MAEHLGNKILIVDFGSQVTQLIARRLREEGIYCEIFPFQAVTKTVIDKFNPNGFILSGGPASITRSDTPRIPQAVFEAKRPIFAICYGQQAMCQQLGGRVDSIEGEREYGRAQIEVVDDSCPLFGDFWQKGGAHPVWMSHSDRVSSLPSGFKPVATSENTPFAVICDPERHYYGVQFHPEVVHTPDGGAILRNFCCVIAGCSGSWNMADFSKEAIQSIRQQAGEVGRVICALSGGVDSSVAALLVSRAIGDRLVCVFVDHGFLRKNEAAQVADMFGRHFDIPLIKCDASERFFKALDGVEEPEQKRRLIGKTFIDVFQEETEKLGDVDFLVQGTLYPDVIESASTGGPAQAIKSHHNVGGLPEKMHLKLIEPLRLLFKDEVRNLGRSLGMGEELLGRHPFPGPGLAIRIPGAVTPEKCKILREIDDIFISEIRKNKLYDEIWQAFAVLLPVRSVGVMGDARSWEYACALRAVCSKDGMTADIYRFEADFLEMVATKIVNGVKGVNRVLYDLTAKPPGTIEWE